MTYEPTVMWSWGTVALFLVLWAFGATCITDKKHKLFIPLLLLITMGITYVGSERILGEPRPMEWELGTGVPVRLVAVWAKPPDALYALVMQDGWSSPRYIRVKWEELKEGKKGDESQLWETLEQGVKKGKRMIIERLATHRVNIYIDPPAALPPKGDYNLE